MNFENQSIYNVGFPGHGCTLFEWPDFLSVFNSEPNVNLNLIHDTDG